jgi:hypothetical protein
MGKTTAVATVEVTKSADFFDYYASLARLPYGDLLNDARPGTQTSVRTGPVGIRDEDGHADGTDPLQPGMIRNAPGADCVVPRLAGVPRCRLVPVAGPGVHAPQGVLARGPAGL